MGYLDNTGLQYLWNKLKEKFALKSHTHDDKYYTKTEVNTKLDGKSNTGHIHDDRYYTESEVDLKLANYQPKGNYAAVSHTHNYAGAASPGGSATSAIKLDTATAGSATCPIYFSDGKPVACTHTLGKSVPSNAVFTDTKYENMKGATSSMAGSSGLVPAPRLGELDKFLKSDGTWGIPKQTKIQICRW